MHFSTFPQDDLDRVIDLHLKNDGVAGGVADVGPFEFPGAHLVVPVLHQDGPRSVGIIAKGHECEVIHSFHWSGKDACKREEKK